MIKKLLLCFLIALCFISINVLDDTAYASELDTSKYEILNPTRNSFSITDKVYLINGKAPTGTEVTIDIYGTTDLTKKSFNLENLPLEEDYIEIFTETITSGNMGFFQKQIDLVMGINKLVIDFNLEGIPAMEYIIFVYDESISQTNIINISESRFDGIANFRR
ncbi:MAG TPA: hypothetical protein VFC79_02870 [Tissierellaceae bacterium]|nr:hypothetical protein [Tissierellaceae bacterium]